MGRIRQETQTGNTIKTSYNNNSQLYCICLYFIKSRETQIGNTTKTSYNNNSQLYCICLYFIKSRETQIGNTTKTSCNNNSQLYCICLYFIKSQETQIGNSIKKTRRKQKQRGKETYSGKATNSEVLWRRCDFNDFIRVGMISVPFFLSACYMKCWSLLICT
uniref:Uncharacterized protein n=1 Tax=Populus davidiana TaxID=266767 RepID=A0A6M2F1F8_9ROSI